MLCVNIEKQNALRDAVVDIERHVATGGWDAPIRLFALVRARAALDANPALADELPADVVADSITDENILFSIEQEDLPEIDSLESLLSTIVWPDEVDGAALTVERIVLPPSAEVGLPADEAEALEALKNHPDRQDVRIAAGVMREGDSWCVLRMKNHDTDAEVLSAPDLVPGLVEGLKTTFASE